jgi:hypothetical protein
LSIWQESFNPVLQSLAQDVAAFKKPTSGVGLKKGYVAMQRRRCLCMFLISTPFLVYSAHEAKILNPKVVRLNTQGRYAEAIPIAKEVLAI